MFLLEALGTVKEWLVTPWAMPLIGALAAVLAAVTVDLMSWVRAPVRAVGRAVVVAMVWLVTGGFSICRARDPRELV